MGERKGKEWKGMEGKGMERKGKEKKEKRKGKEKRQGIFNSFQTVKHRNIFQKRKNIICIYLQWIGGGWENCGNRLIDVSELWKNNLHTSIMTCLHPH